MSWGLGQNCRIFMIRMSRFTFHTFRQNNGIRKVLVHQEKSWCIKGFFFCPNNWQTLTRRNCQGVNAFIGEKQIPRLLICNVWSPCVLSLFLMVWHLPITKNKQGNNENTLDIPRNICYNMLNERFPVWNQDNGLYGSIQQNE